MTVYKCRFCKGSIDIIGHVCSKLSKGRLTRREERRLEQKKKRKEIKNEK